MPPSNACHGFCTGPCGSGGGERRAHLFDQKITSPYHGHAIDHHVSVDRNLKVEELNGLTAEQRERIYEELHGIVDVVEETPELVSECLQKMRHYIIARVPKTNKKAWERALFLRPGLDKDDKFHLMFLRAERFDPAKAAAKICRHFEHKLELFGDSKLVKRITLDDLDEETKQMFSRGSLQFLTNSDRNGRGIYFITANAWELVGWKTIMRYAWYTIYSAIQDNEEIQKRGVVQIVNFTGVWRHRPTQIVETIRPGQHIVSDWPFRECGLHVCYDNATVRSILNALSMIAGKELRIRERTHFGSALEVQYSLLTFGVSLPNAFTPNQGIMSIEYLGSYLQQRLEIEEEWKRREQTLRDANPGFGEYPTELDVLMGRGQARTWIGNQSFNTLTQKYAGSYVDDVQNRFDKTMMAIEIVQRIQLSGGRFLERTDDGWVTVSDQVAKEKANQALRSEGRRPKGGGAKTPMSLDK